MEKDNWKTALADEQVALRVLGGLGVRNHVNEAKHVESVIKVMVDITNIDPEDVECMLVVIKTRTLGNTTEEDKFSIVGATIGNENEVMAMQAVSAARLRQMILNKEYQDGKVGH